VNKNETLIPTRKKRQFCYLVCGKLYSLFPNQDPTSTKLIEAANWNYTQFIMSQIHYEPYPTKCFHKEKNFTLKRTKNLKTLHPHCKFSGGGKIVET
jgi:hypothetical protein